MSKVSPTWDGNAMTQEDMMIKDTVLVLDGDDNVIGSASKRTSHEFTSEQARGILHRAFSVFLFDESTGELLLQQRASSKITFPNVRVENEHAVWFRESSSPANMAFLSLHCYHTVLFLSYNRCLLHRYGPTLAAHTPFMEWNPTRWISQTM